MERLEGLNRKLTIISDIEVNKMAMNRACRVIGNQVQIKGFRKGKAPSHLVSLYYPKDVKAAAASILSQEAFLYGCVEQNISPLGEPKVEKADFNDDGTFVSEVLVEVKPEISPTGYVGMRLEKPEVDVEHILKHIVDNAKSQHAVETEAKEIGVGSVATIDFKVMVKDEEITSGKDHNFLIAEGQEPPFGENLFGMKTGNSKDETIVMPTGHEYEGQKATVKIDIKSIVNKRDPSDEELVEKMAAPSYEELMDLFKKQAERRAFNDERRALEEQITDKLVETHEFEVPEKWVSEEEKYTIQQLQVSNPDDETKRKIRNMSERNIRRSFILEAIYNVEKISITEKEFDDVIKAEAERIGMGRLALKNHLTKQGLMDGVVATIKHRKVFDIILNQAQIESVEKTDNSCEIPENPLG